MDLAIPAKLSDTGNNSFVHMHELFYVVNIVYVTSCDLVCRGVHVLYFLIYLNRTVSTDMSVDWVQYSVLNFLLCAS